MPKAMRPRHRMMAVNGVIPRLVLSPGPAKAVKAVTTASSPNMTPQATNRLRVREMPLPNRRREGDAPPPEGDMAAADDAMAQEMDQAADADAPDGGDMPPPADGGAEGDMPPPDAPPPDTDVV